MAVYDETLSPLFIACRDGDVTTVRQLLPSTTLAMINKKELQDDTPLRVASSNGNRIIVHLLHSRVIFLKTSKPNEEQTFDEASALPEEVTINRLIENATERFSKSAELVWVFDRDDAYFFSRRFQCGFLKDRGLKRTVKKILQAEFIKNGEDTRGVEEAKSHLQKALEQQDSTKLLTLYSLEGPFYTNLNRFMAPPSRSKTVKRVFHKWSGYFTGHIMKNKVFDEFRFTGRTFRGALISRKECDQYKRDIYICNKAFQSTSRAWEVALDFAINGEIKPESMPVIFVYMVTNKKYALDITNFSDYKEEQEVLLSPGILWKVVEFDENCYPVHIRLHQIQFKNLF